MVIYQIIHRAKTICLSKNETGVMYMLWRSTGDDMLRKYDFTYNAVNRLTGADFNQLNSNSFSKAAQIDFSVSGLTYDANGNILTMNQKGWKLGGSVTIDSLLYTYISNSNKLLNVLDRKNDTATKLGDFRSSTAYMNSLSNNKTTSATDYTYDANGNLTVDKNKDISLIHYNYLNLPDSIVVTNKGHITYTYDAAGNKLKKVTTEGSKVTTTLYLFGNFVNDTLQFLPTEEGRIRFNIATSSLQYDYFIKDHLGNIRMVLTEQKDTSFYPDASLETATIANERLYYSGVDTGRVNKSTVSGYPTDTYTNPNDYIQKLNGNGPRVGTGIVLKVMAGDKFNLRVNSWWNSNNTPGTPVNPLNDLLSALNSGVAGASSGHYTTTDLSSASALNPGATDFLNSHTGYNSSIPKAFVNWILFDEQFKFVSSSSGFEQIGSSNTFTTHTRTNVAINKSGYLYVYVSNETPNIDVYFDNLQVTHIRGPLLEADQYYPYGLLMRNLSYRSMSFGKPENKYMFNDGDELQNNEFNDGSGLELYETEFRDYDPQIGRFIQIDALSEITNNNSPYSYALNNPIKYNDPFGLDTVSKKDRRNAVPGDIFKLVKKGKHHKKQIIYLTKGEGGAWFDENGTAYYFLQDVPSEDEKNRAKAMLLWAQDDVNDRALATTRIEELVLNSERLKAGMIMSMDIGVSLPLVISGGAESIPYLVEFSKESGFALYFYGSQVLNGLSEEFFLALRYSLRNVLNPSQLLRLEKLAEKYRDLNKFLDQLKKYKDLVDSIKKIINNNLK